MTTRRLVELIRDEIDRAGPITFSRFMELALYEPELGYYRQAADRPTDTGDFLTAPEAHPIFGWTLARQIEEMWILLGSPPELEIAEYGAGSGTLGLAILDGFRRHGAPLAEIARYRPIESNPHRIADLYRRFDEAGFTGRLASRDERDDGGGGHGEDRDQAAPAIVVANEFLDALPVHRVVVRGGVFLELFVTWRDGFVEVPAPPSTPALARRLQEEGVTLAEGQIAEICLEIEPWMAAVARRLAPGYLIVVDYGYPAAELYGPRHRAGTLLGYRGHHVVDDPFRDPGEQDLTAHVDFTTLERAAAAHDLAMLGSATQAQFLAAAGLEEELRAIQQSTATAFTDYLRARSSVGRMLDPGAMGRFKVFVAGRGVPPTVPAGAARARGTAS